MSGNAEHEKALNEDAEFIAPGARILFVDDVKTNLRVAEGLLSPYKMYVQLCEDGFDALRKVIEHKYDIIFADHMMPEMDGVELVRRMRKLKDIYPYLGDVPIVAFTGNVTDGIKQMFIESGFTDYITKPLNLNELNNIIATYLPETKKVWRKLYKENKTVEAADGADAVVGAEQDDGISGVDMALGLSLAADSEELYKELLSYFCLDAVSKGESIDITNLQRYTTDVHAIKSAAATIGAMELSDMAKRLETAGKMGDVVYIEQKNDAFLAELEGVANSVKRYLERHTD